MNRDIILLERYYMNNTFYDRKQLNILDEKLSIIWNVCWWRWRQLFLYFVNRNNRMETAVTKKKMQVRLQEFVIELLDEIKKLEIRFSENQN